MARRKIGWSLSAIIVSILGFATAQSAQALTPCTATTATPARTTETTRVPANTLNCQTAGYISVASGQIFRCHGAENTEGNMAANQILIKPTGGATQLLPIQDFGPSLTEMTLYTANLGGSAAPEHVLALWQAQQNGFGTNFWTVSVFDASWHLLQTFDQVEDFGPHHLVQGSGSCALAITKYDRHQISGQNAPLYYEARFVGIVRNRLGTAPGFTPVKRRYTFAFERQRLATFDRQPGLAKVSDLTAWLNARN